MPKITHKFIHFLLIAILFAASPGIASSQAQVPHKSIFLTPAEKTRLINAPSTSPTAALLASLQARVEKRALTPNLTDPGATTEWWHHAAEYLTDAALVHAVRPSPKVNAWLRASVLEIVRRPVADWAGPPFRGHTEGSELFGSLETGHLAWGTAIAYDLAADLFTPSEKAEILAALRDKGMQPSRRFLDNTNFFHNWNCVLLAGFTVAAAVLDDQAALAEAAKWMPIAKDHFQKDGSYGESLQYANYAAYSIMLAQEALVRKVPGTPTTLEPYARMVNWAAYAYFYRKPLSGWPLMDWPRSANFGDSAAMFRPSGDLLVHIAARTRKTMPQQAGLASWLFNTLYFPANEPGPHDLASFGFVNDFGFLSVIMMADAAPAVSPQEAKLPLTAAFSGGDAFARDAWGGMTTLAARLPSEPRHASAHLHGDANSFILVHNKERLLVDPGHSCYRDITHALEGSTETHNTATFEVAASATSPARTLVQRGGMNRPLHRDNGQLRGGTPSDIGGKQLIAARVDDVSVIGSDAAQLYGAPLRTYSRFWIMGGANALFIVDRIEADVPVRTTWNWLLNNRDGQLSFQMNRPKKLLARRGDAGVNITHYGNGNLNGPVYALVHDSYNPLPAARGSGVTGTGMLMRWRENAPSAARTVVHTLAVDTHAAVLGWDSQVSGNNYTLSSADRQQKWTLTTAQDGSFNITNAEAGKTYTLRQDVQGKWSFALKR